MSPPILLDLPETIETSRLLIRPPRPGDGPTVSAAILESLDRLQVWMPWANPAPTLENTEEFCRRSYSQWIARSNFPLLLFLKDGGMAAGGCGLHPRNWEVPSFEIGYWTRFEGLGYVTEAVQAVTTFAVEGMGAERLEIRCDSRNTRSRRTAERSGFQLEGELRKHDRTPTGDLRSTLIFSLLPGDRP